jgi:hypothetical protein
MRSSIAFSTSSSTIPRTPPLEDFQRWYTWESFMGDLPVQAQNSNTGKVRLKSDD